MRGDIPFCLFDYRTQFSHRGIARAVGVGSTTWEIKCGNSLLRRSLAFSGNVYAVAQQSAAGPIPCQSRRMFLFFSNRIGCLASIGISIGLTVLLLLFLGIL